ncbi:MAG: hypothetical protein NTW67_02680 [Candidatus Woesearchaeota archaeon]|nr:hypothetical protein [Candidatus Woesearchaeota archaeon]
MKKIILLLLLLAVACAPVQPIVQNTDTKAPAEPQVVTKEQVVSQPQTIPETMKTEKIEPVPGTPLEPTEKTGDFYNLLGCQQLLSAEEFAKTCGKDAAYIAVTYKTGSRNCVVNIKDKQNERYTAGFTLTGYADAAAAKTEFERRLVVLKVGADDSIGERAYVPPMKLSDREALEFLRNKFIVEGGSDTRLCSKEGIAEVAKIVDSHIK